MMLEENRGYYFNFSMIQLKAYTLCFHINSGTVFPMKKYSDMKAQIQNL